MDAGTTVSALSLLISAVALSLTGWQAHRNIRIADHAKQIPVATELIREYRSVEFQRCFNAVLADPPEPPPSGGLAALPDDARSSVFHVCAYFEYVATLVIVGLVSEELILSMMSTPLMRIWMATSSVIEAERQHRARTYSPNVDSTFLPHYELLIQRIELRWQKRSIALGNEGRFGA